uniref:Uncharacterized protein n=1 Tax=Lepeophtheirus salmonis TaxID=72036 RepID=A0A0K2TXE8_LEPSM
MSATTCSGASFYFYVLVSEN